MHSDGAQNIPTHRGVGRRCPPWVAWASLPAAFLISQLGGAIVHQLVVLVGRATGADGAAASAYGTVGGMAAGGGLLLAVAVLVPHLLSLHPVEALGLRPVQMPVVFWAVVGTIGLSPVADLMMSAMAHWFPETSLGNVMMLHNLATRFPVAVIWPVFALLPGLAEEAYFRGLFLRAFPSKAAAIVLSGSCFALFHFDPHHIAGVWPLGLFLAYVAAHHGLWPSVIAHVANNSLALASVHIPAMDVGYGTDEPMPLYWLPLGLSLSALCAFRLHLSAAQRAPASG